MEVAWRAFVSCPLPASGPSERNSAHGPTWLTEAPCWNFIVIKSMYVFSIDLCTYISLEPDRRTMKAGHNDVDIQDPESLPCHINPFITIKWSLPLRRNFCNKTQWYWVSLEMVISIVFPTFVIVCTSITSCRENIGSVRVSQF